MGDRRQASELRLLALLKALSSVRQHQGPILFHVLLDAAIPLFLGQVGYQFER
jgi:hypothetical protein